jgi:hypothetical protein
VSKSRQRTANRDLDCSECYRFIADGDPIWYLDGNVHCVTCAARKGIDCPQCHGSKKPQFAVCYECKNDASRPKGATLV